MRKREAGQQPPLHAPHQHDGSQRCGQGLTQGRLSSVLPHRGGALPPSLPSPSCSGNGSAFTGPPQSTRHRGHATCKADRQIISSTHQPSNGSDAASARACEGRVMACLCGRGGALILGIHLHALDVHVVAARPAAVGEGLRRRHGVLADGAHLGHAGRQATRSGRAGEGAGSGRIRVTVSQARAVSTPAVCLTSSASSSCLSTPSAASFSPPSPAAAPPPRIPMRCRTQTVQMASQRLLL